MGKNLASGKRPQAKLKMMAKLGENLYKTTKIYRMVESIGQKPKWNNFMVNTAEEHRAWREWWNSPQSTRWKNLEAKPQAAEPPAES